MADVIFGLLFAFENRATFVLQREAFGTGGKHGAYAEIVEVLGLGGVPTVAEANATRGLAHVFLDSWDDAYKHADACDVLLQTHDQGCRSIKELAQAKPGWCFFTKVGAYDATKSYLRAWYRQSSHRPSSNVYLGLEGQVVVAWHVREGDIRLQANHAYFAKVYGQLAAALEGMPHTVFVFSERKLSAHFAFMKKYPLRFVHGLSVADTLYHLAHADVLVTSGSNFAALAAVLSGPNSVVLQARPKEHVDGVFDLAEHAVLDASGQLARPSPEELRAAVRRIAAAKGRAR